MQRTLRQRVWEGNFMLAKRKVNTKYLIGIFFLLNSLVRLDFFSLIHSFSVVLVYHSRASPLVPSLWHTMKRLSFNKWITHSTL